CQALDQIVATGSTDIAAALLRAREILEQASSERIFRALVVTDGQSEFQPAQTAAQNLAARGALIDAVLIDRAERGEAVGRAFAFHGNVSAVTSAAELHEQIGQARTAQEQQRADAEALVARYDEERSRLAAEKPLEERLAFTAAYPSNILPE